MLDEHEWTGMVEHGAESVELAHFLGEDTAHCIAKGAHGVRIMVPLDRAQLLELVDVLAAIIFRLDWTTYQREKTEDDCRG
ncbi:hypothetical protein [Streptomyces hydrogenans]